MLIGSRTEPACDWKPSSPLGFILKNPGTGRGQQEPLLIKETQVLWSEVDSGTGWIGVVCGVSVVEWLWRWWLVVTIVSVVMAGAGLAYERSYQCDNRDALRKSLEKISLNKAPEWLSIYKVEIPLLDFIATVRRPHVFPVQLRVKKSCWLSVINQLKSFKILTFCQPICILQTNFCTLQEIK